MDELEHVAGSILGAKSYFEVFGPSNRRAPSDHIKRVYRRLARKVHPDCYKKAEEKERAQEAFKRLGVHYEAAKKAAARGNYGEVPKLIIKSRSGEYEVGEQVAKGEIADLFRATDTKKTKELVFKVARLPLDNELLSHEAEALRILHSPDDDPAFYPFFPELTDTFLYSDGAGVQKRVNILPSLTGWYNLEELRSYYPKGVSPLDMSWIWRRLLWLLGYAHQQDLLHLAVLPSHIMILPEQHGVMLVDWCYSQKTNSNEPFPVAKAVSGEYLGWYPKEITEKVSPTYGTDIHLAAKSMVYLMGGESVETLGPEVPRGFRAYFRGSMQENQKVRPQDAWEMLGEFDELLERIGKPYFPRRFHALTIPR